MISLRWFVLLEYGNMNVILLHCQLSLPMGYENIQCRRTQRKNGGSGRVKKHRHCRKIIFYFAVNQGFYTLMASVLSLSHLSKSMKNYLSSFLKVYPQATKISSPLISQYLL